MSADRPCKMAAGRSCENHQVVVDSGFHALIVAIHAVAGKEPEKKSAVPAVVQSLIHRRFRPHRHLRHPDLQVLRVQCPDIR